MPQGDRNFHLPQTLTKMVGKFHPQLYDLEERIGVIYYLHGRKGLCLNQDLRCRRRGIPLVWGLGGQLSVLVNFASLMQGRNILEESLS